MEEKNFTVDVLKHIVNIKPGAAAAISGSEKYPEIRGRAAFWQTRFGVITAVYVLGLPKGDVSDCGHPVFALHIHEGVSCSGNVNDPFADAMTHYNPKNCQHPYHAGDLPPLFSNGSVAWFAVLTDRFVLDEVLGRAVIIHAKPDDFTTQPSGNSGEKIACGIIKAN